MAAAKENPLTQRSPNSECQSFSSRHNVSARADDSNNSNIQDNNNMIRPGMCDSVTNHDYFARVKDEFNKNRKILIKNIPLVSSEEVKIFLGYYLSKDVEIDRDLNEAVVTLENGEEAEEVVENLNHTKLREEEVSISILPSKKLICLAHLPLDFTDQDLRNLVSSRGNIEKCFLMKSRISGENKGYGFVEFSQSCEHASYVKNHLDWTCVRDYLIHCDIVEENIELCFNRLHPRCLLIDNLPKDHSNSLELREIFSQSADPIYCQIMTNKNGDPLGYGIVEYRSADQAEKAQNEINGLNFKNVKLRVTCCIPGKSAVTIYNRITMKLGNKENKFEKTSLLPAPIDPCSSVINHPIVKALSFKYTNLLLSFKKVLLQLHESYVNQANEQNSKPGLLGPAPNLCINPCINPNLQLGLCILLALQLQSQREKLSGPLAQFSLLQTIQNKENLNEQVSSSEQLSILGDPSAAQASILIQNFLTNLQHITSTSNSSMEDRNAVLSQLTNLSCVNLNTLVQLGQLMCNVDNIQSNGGDGLLGNPPVPGLMDDLRHGNGVNMNDGILPLPSKEQDGILGCGPPDQSVDVFMTNIQALASGRKPPGLDFNSFYNNSGDNYSNGDISSFSDLNFSSNFNLGSGAYSQSSRGRVRGRQRAGRVKNGGSLMDRRLGSMGNSDQAGYNFSPYQEENCSQDNFFQQPYNVNMNVKNFSDEYSSQLPSSHQGKFNQNYSNNIFQQSISCPASDFSNGNGPYQFSASSNEIEQYCSSNNRNRKNKLDISSQRLYNEQSTARNSGPIAEGYNHSFHSDRNYSLSDNMQERYSNTPVFRGGSQTQSSCNRGPGVPGCQSRDKFDDMFMYRQGSYGSNSSGHSIMSHSDCSFSSNTNSSFSSYGQDVFEPSHSEYNNDYDTSYEVSNTRTKNKLIGNTYSPKQFQSLAPRSMKTSAGQKRSYSHLLPQPEASPEGEYIGQHSQGLGGHYADSYVRNKRQKLDQRF